MDIGMSCLVMEVIVHTHAQQSALVKPALGWSMLGRKWRTDNEMNIISYNCLTCTKVPAKLSPLASQLMLAGNEPWSNAQASQLLHTVNQPII